MSQQYTKERGASKSEEKWCYSKHDTKTKSVVKQIKIKSLATWETLENPSCPLQLTQSQDMSHSETSVVQILTQTSTFLTVFITERSEKKSLNVDPKLQNDQNDQHYLAGNIKMSDRFATN